MRRPTHSRKSGKPEDEVPRGEGSRLAAYSRYVTSEDFAEAIERLRAEVTPDLQRLLDALIADPDDPAVEETWQEILEEAIREA